ncbi:MAG TPA: immunoglobulin-like domain-containing protein [Longimicrobiales bacterium]|nr:immunoglobulin-like domain-containing protein [Longimicrobiales bacterium]
MKAASFAPLALAAVLLTGCDDIFGSGPEGIELRATASHYAAGDLATIRLTNHTDESIGYNLCMLRLERREPDGWVEIPFREALPCLAIVYSLAPGESDQFVVELPDSLAGGDYRARTHVSREEESVDLATPPFVVVSPVEPS